MRPWCARKVEQPDPVRGRVRAAFRLRAEELTELTRLSVREPAGEQRKGPKAGRVQVPLDLRCGHIDEVHVDAHCSLRQPARLGSSGRTTGHPRPSCPSDGGCSQTHTT